MAGRPAKSTAVNSSKMSNEERAVRQETEDKIRGKPKKIEPLPHLNEEQVLIFRNLVKLLKKSDILGEIDTYILSNCAISIHRLQQIETMVNTDTGYLFDKDLMNTKKKYTDEFFRCCNELCLSPQSRAKIASSITANVLNEPDPLLEALGMK